MDKFKIKRKTKKKEELPVLMKKGQETLQMRLYQPGTCELTGNGWSSTKPGLKLHSREGMGQSQGRICLGTQCGGAWGGSLSPFPVGIVSGAVTNGCGSRR